MSTTSQTALITGASGGIGLELARQFAQHGHDLVLVARSQDKLAQLAQELQAAHGVTAHVMPADLTDPDAPNRLHAQLQEAGVPVHVLVNNAGFGAYGLFHESTLEEELAMLQLNVVALTHLTHLFLQEMVTRRAGRVLNVASTAAFQPGPLMAVYYASKAYVLHFSEALANELAPFGVTVTALCPGPTVSGFQARADMEESRLVQNRAVMMDAATVARQGYEALMAGKPVVIPGLFNKVGALLPRFVPRHLTVKTIRFMQERTH